MYYKCHKINSNRGGSYIDSPDWIKSKQASINPITKKDKKCFQYVVTVPLNYEEIKRDPQRITKINAFINKYNWEGIHFPSKEDDKKIFENNYVTTALNVLYVKKEKNYCLNCLHSFRTKKTNLNRIKKYVKIKIFVM